jgi:hypothetical protein
MLGHFFPPSPLSSAADPFSTVLDARDRTTGESPRASFTCDAYAVASLILAGIDPAVDMARHVEQAGVRILELNIGTPYASQARGVVSTELDPERVRAIVGAVRARGNHDPAVGQADGFPRHAARL